MDDTARGLLTVPFSPEDIRSRQGHNGTRLCYVESWRVIERLNEALNHDWSFEILEHQVLDDEVLVKAELSCTGIRKQAFGSSSITRSRDTNAAVSIVDDLKSAASDALKKAASLLGVGLEVFSGQVRETQASTPRGRGMPAPGRKKFEGGAGPSAGMSSSVMSPSTTAEQVQHILDLAARCNLEEGPFLNRIKKTYGVTVTELSAAQREDLMGKLTRAASVIS